MLKKIIAWFNKYRIAPIEPMPGYLIPYQEKLSRCPFCGEIVEIDECFGMVHPEKIPTAWSIDCNKCGVTMLGFNGLDNLVNNWNGRTQ